MAGDTAGAWANFLVGSTLGSEAGTLFSGALSGAASGAAMGSLGGPHGTAIGAALGGALGLASGGAQAMGPGTMPSSTTTPACMTPRRRSARRPRAPEAARRPSGSWMPSLLRSCWERGRAMLT